MKCKECGSLNVKSIVIDRIDHTPCEIEYRCRDCNSVVAYWAYGSFEPNCEESDNAS